MMGKKKKAKVIKAIKAEESTKAKFTPTYRYFVAEDCGDDTASVEYVTVSSEIIQVAGGRFPGSMEDAVVSLRDALCLRGEEDMAQDMENEWESHGRSM